MVNLKDILFILKYLVVVAIFVCIVLTPIFLSVANDRSKYDAMRTRVGSLLFGWSFIGWFFALFVSAKK